jgi:Subtilase family
LVASSLENIVNRSPQTPEHLIQLCEPRLALSASLPIDWWLEYSGSNDQSGISDNETHPTGDLVAQSQQIAAPLGLDGSGQTAVVIDTGIAFDHISLASKDGQTGFGPGYRVVGGWDFAENDANPYDDGPAGFHGTFVASLLGGSGANSSGGSAVSSGVAPGVDLVALRVFDDRGASDLSWVESSLQWVHNHRNEFEHPITTVNLSLGAVLNDVTAQQARSILGDELQQLRNDGILVFAAAGNFNDSLSDILYPAADDNVVAVTSVGADGQLSDFAQRKEGILAARGESIQGAVPDHVYGWDGNVNDTAKLNGTSLAAPQVAGASIIIRQALMEAGLSADSDDVLQHLRKSSALQTDPSNGDTYQTIDLGRALTNITHEKLENSENGSLADAPYLTSHESDRLRLDLTEGVRLQDETRSYTFLPDADGVYRLDGGYGGDELTIQGGTGIERVLLRSEWNAISEIVTGDKRIEFNGFEEVLFDGGGGNDRAAIFDSAASDVLNSYPTRAKLESYEYQIEVTSVPNIYVYGNGGGNNSAYVHDSVDNDHIVIRPEFTNLSSDSTVQLVVGFESVSAYSSAGGRDTVEIYDCLGDDTLYLSKERATFVGNGYQVAARGFDDLIAFGGSGGNDQVRVYLEDVDDLRVGERDFGWKGSSIGWIDDQNQRREARGFADQKVFEQSQLVDWDEIKRRHLDANRRLFESL